jgi:hypothetical protein
LCLGSAEYSSHIEISSPPSTSTHRSLLTRSTKVLGTLRLHCPEAQRPHNGQGQEEDLGGGGGGEVLVQGMERVHAHEDGKAERRPRWAESAANSGAAASLLLDYKMNSTMVQPERRARATAMGGGGGGGGGEGGAIIQEDTSAMSWHLWLAGARELRAGKLKGRWGT